MIFNSWSYILFLTFFVSIYWILNPRYRIGLLAFASFLFYGLWRFDFAFLIVFSAIIDFISSKKIYRNSNKTIKKYWLSLSLCINLGLLIFFKYTYFLIDNISFLINNNITIPFSIILPLGISFYTFQTISYSIDIYRGVTKPVNNFLTFFTYVSFWPQLIAGPILRTHEVIPQLIEFKKFNLKYINQGVYIILIGLFKKVVIADSLALEVDKLFLMNVDILNAPEVWVSAFLFGFQIYFDFSGYCDIAIGSAKMLGINFPDNFYWPYLSTSPKQFWGRWHISLSSWIRDYLYLPLTGQKFRSKSTGGLSSNKSLDNNRNIALFITWFLMGLWHGAGWNFVIWGLMHASYIMIFRFIPYLKKLDRNIPFVTWVLTLFFTMASWIPFRSISVSQSLSMLQKILDPTQYLAFVYSKQISYFNYLYVIVILSFIYFSYQLKNILFPSINNFRPILHIPLVIFMALMIIIYLQTNNQFIYFQF